MGLDMYLIRKKYVGAEYEHRNVKGTIFITINGKELPIDFDRVSYIEEKIGYWRKANAIHKWFVDNVQDGEDDCRDAYVELSKLEELLKLCQKVRKSIKLVDGQVANGYSFNDKGEKIYKYTEGKIIEDTSVCEKLLPTTDGFFFGDTQYNEWYVEDIEHTIDILKKVIKEEKEMRENGIYNDYYYHASW